jgi:hypothetical protein
VLLAQIVPKSFICARATGADCSKELHLRPHYWRRLFYVPKFAVLEGFSKVV